MGKRDKILTNIRLGGYSFVSLRLPRFPRLGRVSSGLKREDTRLVSRVICPDRIS